MEGMNNGTPAEKYLGCWVETDQHWQGSQYNIYFYDNWTWEAEHPDSNGELKNWAWQPNWIFGEDPFPDNTLGWQFKYGL